MIKKILFILGCCCTSFALAHAQRIVALSPDVADIIVALGAGSEVVGKPAHTKDPALAQAEEIGMHRAVNAEVIAHLKPDLVLGSWMAEPSSIYQTLSDLGIQAENVAADESMQTYRHSIERIGQLLGRQQEAQRLRQDWDARLKNIANTQTRYLLSYDGHFVAGRNTVGDRLIKLAGGINAADTVDGFKPLSREAWLAARPDVIIIAEHHKQALGGIAGLTARPEIAPSPAALKQHIYFWPANDYLRYGLNTPEIIEKLYQLHQ